MTTDETEARVEPSPPKEMEIVAPGNALVPTSAPAAPQAAPIRRKLRWKPIALVLLLAAGGAAGGFYWWQTRPPTHPVGIVSGNGRLEAEEIDIDTKFAGRVAELLVDEGDMVSPGQVVARMDTRDLEATLHKDEALVLQARRSLEEAHASVEQQNTQVTLAQQEFDRTKTLFGQGYATNELLDQRRQSLDGANAGLTAAQARVGEAERALDAATHDVELYKVNIADNTLVSPTAGRIQYRIANVGEVLPAGGKVFTLLDVSDVYMDIYLATADAGRAKVGSDGRIVLDAYPNFAAPAQVSFIATQAQFTPKAVETKNERDKLMFRVKVRVDRDLLRAHATEVRTGLPGLAYVRLDPKVEWPAALRGPTSQ
ncbi:MAG TPA: HlyD family efflux transporter periplasmic adaptor subunit [Roseiarcus sp.]|nr:HlyD family efflux transporter periplasmic adaptor subunit [Roseiarcus sp.]